LPSSFTLSPCTQPDTRRRRAAKPLTSEAWLPLLLVCYSFRCYTVSHNRHTRLGEKALYVKDFSDDVLKEIRRFLESMNPDPLWYLYFRCLRFAGLRLVELVLQSLSPKPSCCFLHVVSLLHLSPVSKHGGRLNWCDWGPRGAAWDTRYKNWNVRFYPDHHSVDINGLNKATVVASTWVHVCTLIYTTIQTDRHTYTHTHM
jgi:hypothetical protein